MFSGVLEARKLDENLLKAFQKMHHHRELKNMDVKHLLLIKLDSNSLKFLHCHR